MPHEFLNPLLAVTYVTEWFVLTFGLFAFIWGLKRLLVLFTEDKSE